jgi:hypothetical protein
MLSIGKMWKHHTRLVPVTAQLATYEDLKMNVNRLKDYGYIALGGYLVLLVAWNIWTRVGGSHEERSIVQASPAESPTQDRAGLVNVNMSNAVLEATEQAAADVGSEIPENEIIRLGRYGICASINKATVMLANEKNNGTLDGLIRLSAHEATIYSLAVSEAFENMSGSSRSSLTEVVSQSVDSFYDEHFLGTKLEGAKLARLKNENCNFIKDMSNQAKRLMDDYPSDYESRYESNKRLR